MRKLRRPKTLREFLEREGIYSAAFKHDKNGNMMSYWDSSQARQDRWDALPAPEVTLTEGQIATLRNARRG